MDKRLKKLSRVELLELMIHISEEYEKLRGENARLKKALASRRLPRSAKVGSIAEAALHANGYFDAAQRAADEYLREIKHLRDELAQRSAKAPQAMDPRVEQQAQALLQDAQVRARQIISQANGQAQAILADAKARSEAAVADANRRSHAILAQASQEAAGLSSVGQSAATARPAEAYSTVASASNVAQPASYQGKRIRSAMRGRQL